MIGDRSFILAVNSVPTLEAFLHTLGIKPQGLGAQLFEGVYRNFFSYSKDLREEYRRFYSVEYTNFETYLDLVHEVDLEPHELEKRHVFKIKSPSMVVDQAYDDNTMDAVVACIRKLETPNED